MKKGKVSRKIKPRNTVADYFKNRDEFMNFGSRNTDGNPVDEYFESYEYKGSIPVEDLPKEKNTEKSNSKSKQWKSINKPEPKKVLTFLGYLGIIIGCMYQCFTFLSIYFKYPTTVELNIANEAKLAFPAVTVCNSNPVKYRIWCEEDKHCDKKANETLEDYRTRQSFLYDRLEKTRRIALGYTLKEFIVFAEYEGEPVIDTFQQYYDFEFTNCYTFNGEWGNNKETKQAIVFNPVTGKSSELVLCVDMDMENYSNISGTTSQRTRMTIHTNDVIPNPTYDAYSLEAGYIYNYGVQRVTTRLLKSPYQTKCRNYEAEKEYRTGARMSQKNCLLECFKTETEIICGCTYRRLALMYDAIPCDEDKKECLEKAEDRVFNICNPQCPMACQKVEFQNVAMDLEPLRQESELYKKGNISKVLPTEDEMNENMACMSIHYGSTETRTLSHRPKYPFIELFSLLGGYSGLWLGFSLLNGYEIALMKLFDYFSKRKNQRKQKSKLFRKRRRYY